MNKIDFAVTIIYFDFRSDYSPFYCLLLIQIVNLSLGQETLIAFSKASSNF